MPEHELDAGVTIPAMPDGQVIEADVRVRATGRRASRITSTRAR